MLSSWAAAAVLALACAVKAQTPSGLSPVISQNVMATFAGTNVVSPPGELIPRAGKHGHGNAPHQLAAEMTD
jgi:hypothetical protein